jgi:hypothetical protein
MNTQAGYSLVAVQRGLPYTDISATTGVISSLMSDEGVSYSTVVESSVGTDCNCKAVIASRSSFFAD